MASIEITYTADIAQLNAKLDEIIKKQEEVGASSRRAGKQISNSAKTAAKEVDVLGNSLSRIGGLVVAAFSVKKIIEFTKSVIDAERKMELLQNRLNFLAQSKERGEELFNRLFLAAKKLGIGIEDLAEGMASFGIAATQAGFSARKTEMIFMQVATGLRAAGATSLQTQRAFYALQQMMSKGVVAAEELRRQLGEALPGANELMVKAYNRLHPAQQLTNREFMKMQEEGKIISREILPEFAKVIEEEFAPALAGKANSLDAAISKINTEFLALKLNLGDTKTFKFFSDVISGHFNRINKIIENETIPFFEKLIRVVGEYVFLGELNNKIIKEGRAIEAIAAAESLEADEKILNNTKEAMSLSKSKRDQKKQEYEEELSQLSEIIKKEDERIEKIKKEQLAIRQKYGESLIRAKNNYGMRKQLEEKQNKELAEIEEKYRDASLARDVRKAKKRIYILQGTLDEIEQEEKYAAERLEEQEKERRKAEEQRLKNEVALAKIRVEEATKGSIEESNARANLAKKLEDLNVFMAKSDEEKQLARVVGEKEANKQIEEARRKSEDVIFGRTAAYEYENTKKLYERRIKAAKGNNEKQLQLALELNEKLEEIRSGSVVDEEEIDPSKDPNLKKIDKTLEIYQKNKDKIAEAIAAPYRSALQKELASTTSHYLELIKLTEENSDERKKLEEALQKELENIRQKYADKEAKGLEATIRKYLVAARRIVRQSGSLINGYMEAERKMRDNAIQAEIQALNARFEAGIIGEEEYQKNLNALKKAQFELERDAAIAKIKMDTAVAILNLFTQLPFPAATLLVPAVLGVSVAQIDAVKSTPMPTFHDGAVDINGNNKMTSGPLKNDEFIAKLQKGESVMTAKETSKYKDVLFAIREDRLPGLIAEKYLIPAYNNSIDDRKSKRSNSSTMELAFQTAELVGAIKNNKRIKIDNLKELSKAINKKSSIDEVIRRRAW